jgi:hypothetical protein
MVSKTIRKSIAQDTIEILEKGFYLNPNWVVKYF